MANYSEVRSLLGGRMPKDASPERLVILLYQECSELLKLVDDQNTHIRTLEETNRKLSSQRNKSVRELRTLLAAYEHLQVPTDAELTAEVDNPCQ